MLKVNNLIFTVKTRNSTWTNICRFCQITSHSFGNGRPLTLIQLVARETMQTNAFAIISSCNISCSTHRDSLGEPHPHSLMNLCYLYAQKIRTRYYWKKLLNTTEFSCSKNYLDGFSMTILTFKKYIVWFAILSHFLLFSKQQVYLSQYCMEMFE